MIRVSGGERAVRDAVIAAAEGSGRTARALADAGAAGDGEALIDLGLPPAEWPAGERLVGAEAARARALALSTPEGGRVVRASVLRAAADADSPLQRAQHAAETAWRDSGARSVALRAGVLMGDCGLAGAFRRGLERWWIVPVAGVGRAKLEPLHVEDFALYCVEAATTERTLDDVYDLGCGEMLSGSLLARGLAENLGFRRWIVGLPGWCASPASAMLASPRLPAAAVRHWLAALKAGLLPQRMSAWDAFPVRPRELREAMAFAAGRVHAIRKRRAEGRFGEWRAPEKKGMLWGQPGQRRRK